MAPDSKGIETEIGGEYHKPPRGVEMLEDTVMRLYDTDRTTLLEENDDELVSKESLINWSARGRGATSWR